jgi:ribosomal protein S18 acetylase RimI-like enzyme
MRYTVRSATTEDGPFLEALYQDSRREEVRAWGWDPQQAEAFLRLQWLAKRQSYAMQYPNAEYRLVTVNDSAAGAYLLNEEPRQIRIVDIAFMQLYRNRGLGTLLLKALQQEAKQREADLLLSVQTHNPARRLYERLGFKETGCDDAGMYLSMCWNYASGYQTAKSKEDNDE